MFTVSDQLVVPLSQGEELEVAARLAAEGWVPVSGTKSWDRLRLIRWPEAKRIMEQLGWGPAEFVSYGRGIIPAPGTDPFPWRARVRVKVADLAPHDGAGYAQAHVFPDLPAQFRAVGNGTFAKGLLLPRWAMKFTGVKAPKGKIVLSPDHFKGERKPEVGDEFEMTVAARPLFPGVQWASWETVIMLAVAHQGDEEFLAELGRRAEDRLTKILRGLRKAVEEGDLAELFDEFGLATWGAKEALSVAGPCKELATLLRQHMSRHVRDALLSAGLLGRRLTLIMSERGAVMDRENGELVVVRMPVRRPQGVATVRLTTEARLALREGFMLVHPSLAQEMDGDDDGDQVAVFDDPLVVEASRKLADLDSAFQSVKAEKVRRRYPVTLQGAWEAAWAAKSAMGAATLQLYAWLLRGNMEQAALWSEQLQREVDNLKWLQPEVEGLVRTATAEFFPWRVPTRSLADLARLPLGEDPVSKIVSRALPVVQGLAEAIDALPELNPMALAVRLRPEAIPEEEDREVARLLLQQWKERWAELRALYGGPVPPEEAVEVMHTFTAEGRKLSIKELGAVVLCAGTFAFKRAVVGLRWAEVCVPREDAKPPEPGVLVLHEFYTKKPIRGEVRTRRCRGGWEVVLNGEGLGLATRHGRLPRRFLGVVEGNRVALIPADA